MQMYGWCHDCGVLFTAMGNHVKPNLINMAQSDSDLARHKARQFADSLNNISNEVLKKGEKEGMFASTKGLFLPNMKHNVSEKVAQVSQDSFSLLLSQGLRLYGLLRIKEGT